MNAIRKIQAVVNTLEQVTVCGSGNLNKLLGCIQTLQQVTTELQKPAEEETHDESGQN